MRQHLDASTPRQVFDPEIHRFACPICFAVVQLLPELDESRVVWCVKEKSREIPVGRLNLAPPEGGLLS